MKILPAVTRPWRIKFSRRHNPPVLGAKKGFLTYRACLRWEFGFSCVFCLCHETDLAFYGVQRTGLTHIEHWIPQSEDATARNIYSNCFYICRLCNLARGASPNEPEGCSLLNPCDRSWREIFLISRDELRPRNEEDRDAIYTIETYDLNDPKKVRLRRLRRLTIGQCLHFLKRTRSLESELLDAVEAGGGENLVRTAAMISQQRRRACRDLQKFRAIPEDFDSSCSCGYKGNHQLPSVLDEQTFELSDVCRPQAGVLQRRKIGFRGSSRLN
jgi:hypothetical protein